MLTQDNVTALCAPFAAQDHEFHRGFVYISEEAITARIEAVDPSWELSLNWITNRETFSTAHVTLTVCGVKRDGIGMATQEYSKTGDKPIGEPEKSAATDALKRAARLFGIGRYLLDAPKDMTDATLIKWLAKITPKAAPDERPAEQPAPELYTFTLTEVAHCYSEKSNVDYYKFGDGVYTFSRDPFRAAGVTECEAWIKLPFNEPAELTTPLTATVKQKGEGRYEIVSVQTVNS